MSIASITWEGKDCILPIVAGVAFWGAYKVPRYISHWMGAHPTHPLAVTLKRSDEVFIKISPMLERYVLVTLIENGSLPTLLCLRRVSKAELKDPKQAAAYLFFILFSSKALETIRILSAYMCRVARFGHWADKVKPRDVELFSLMEMIEAIQHPHVSGPCFYRIKNNKI